VTFTPIFGRRGLSAAELDAAAAWRSKMVPVGRFTTAEDIAAGIAYLGNSDATYAVGSEVTIDGGLGQLWSRETRNYGRSIR